MRKLALVVAFLFIAVPVFASEVEVSPYFQTYFGDDFDSAKGGGVQLTFPNAVLDLELLASLSYSGAEEKDSNTDIEIWNGSAGLGYELSGSEKLSLMPTGKVHGFYIEAESPSEDDGQLGFSVGVDASYQLTANTKAFVGVDYIWLTDDVEIAGLEFDSEAIGVRAGITVSL